MTPKQFATLAAAAAVSVVLALVVHASRAPWSAAAGTERLFPSLTSDAAKVHRIAITQSGHTLTLEKSGETWLLKSEDGYPASNEKIRSLLAALADARLLAPKTQLPARYATLEVEDPADKLARSRLFRLEDANGGLIGEVIAGKTKASAHTGANAETYVRRPGDSQSWLASTLITGDTALKNWADQRVFETKTETIKTLTVARPGEAPYVIKREADGTHGLQDIPAGKKIKYVNMVDNIIEAASFLDFEKVRKRASATGGEAGTVTFETDPGLKITFKVRREKDDAWATIDAAGTGEAKKTADDIMAKAAGWEFAILPSKVDTMLKKRDDLLEDAAS